MVPGLTKRLGLRIKFFRGKRNMTQSILASRAKLSVDTVRRLERGSFSPTLETLSRICDGLDISLDTLCDALQGERPDLAKMTADFVASRSDREIQMVWRVVRAMFDEDN
ncbi:MAG: helix-turn-helix transcriptional regulator [Deltaproteobacteria bacterium]|nr:helix-turn-helix transcriptional regulator [Deltaproteobacteria bacterium]